MQTPDYIMDLQRRILAGEEITAEELNAAIEQLRTERAASAAAPASSRKSSPTVPKETSLAAFLMNRGIQPPEATK